ncbi:MAG: O-antigen ligase family protein [Patescibacteria group bacterium]
MKFARFLIYSTILILPLYYWRFRLAGLPTNFIEILVVLATLTTVWLKLTGQLPAKSAFPLKWPIALMLFGVVIGVVVAADREAALGILKGWFVVPILFFWTLTVLKDQLNWQALAWLVVINVNLVAAYALLQYSNVIGLIAHQNIGGELGQYIDQKRALAFFESPNYLAMYLVPLLVLAFGYLKSRGIWLLTLILPIAAVVLSGSRSGIFALALGAAAVWLLGRKQSRAVTVGTIGLAAVAVIGAVVLMGNDASSGSLRQYIWQQSLIFGADHWLTGIGAGQFQAYFINHADSTVGAYQFVLPYALHPHNLFLAFWLSAGLVGLVGFGWLLVELVRLAKPKLGDPLTLGAFGALLAVLAHGLFDTTFFKNDLSLIFFLIAAIVAGIQNHESQRV